MRNAADYEPETYLEGVQHWAQMQPMMVPRFEVFRYLGRNRDNGLYYFKSVRSNAVIGKNHYQLHVPNFKPFLINHERMTGQKPDGIKANANL